MGSISWPLHTMQINDKEFAILRSLIHQRFGIFLSDKKRGLLVIRLQKYMQKAGFTNFQQYADHVQKDKTGKALGYLADLISTNHTFFFRESGHFDFMRTIALPEITQLLKSQNSHDLRIWCAAASTGEEPYGLMITMKDFFGSEYVRWDAGLLATDISAEALNEARAGIYDNESVSRIPIQARNHYFNQVNRHLWEVHDSIKKEITFRRFNLIKPKFPFKKPFHIIFCRNVMIYFDQPTIERLVTQFYNFTVPGGYLFVGFSESLGRINNPYNYVQPATYRRPI